MKKRNYKLEQQKKLKKRKMNERLFLMDPQIVPKNKTLRVLFFSCFNIIFIASFPCLAILINFPYGYLCWILIFCIMSLFNIQAYYIYVERYPLNQYSEYKLDLKKDKFMIDGEEFYITILKKKSLYEAYLDNKIIVFDMKGCWFPLTVIKSYLGRQFVMSTINEQKLVSDCMGKNLPISKEFNTYTNIKLKYVNKRKTKTTYLVKNSRTKMNILMKAINGHGYITWHTGNTYGRSRIFIKVTEEAFVDEKDKHIKKIK